MYKIQEVKKEAKSKLLRDVSRCHVSAFPNAFSTSLGFHFLMKNYSWYLDHPDAFLLCARNENDKVLGYAGGLLMHEKSVHGSSTSIMQYAFKEAVINLLLRPWLFFHPEMRPNYRLILKNIRLKLFPQKKSAQPSVNSQKRIRSLGLVVIGTSKSARGTGVGSALLQAFEEKGRELNAERLHLSVKKSNKTAIQAYERNGWLVAGEQGQNLEMYKPL